jgi:hypothetical protein
VAEPNGSKHRRWTLLECPHVGGDSTRHEGSIGLAGSCFQTRRRAGRRSRPFDERYRTTRHGRGADACRFCSRRTASGDGFARIHARFHTTPRRVNDDFKDLLEALIEADARFLVVGAHALARRTRRIWRRWAISSDFDVSSLGFSESRDWVALRVSIRHRASRVRPRRDGPRDRAAASSRKPPSRLCSVFRPPSGSGR